MSICAESPGCFEVDNESGEPMETFVYAKLIQLGCASQSLARSGEEDGLSMNYLARLAHPETDAATTVGEMHPELLKSVSIIQKCNLEISSASAINVANKDEGIAYNMSYIRKKSEIPNGKRGSLSQRLAKQTGGSGKGSRPSEKKFSRVAPMGRNS